MNLRSLTGALLLLGAGVSAEAGLIVGTDNNLNCYPFACAASDNQARYQQVYGASAFTGPLQIAQLTFVAAAGSVGQPIDSASYALYFSYTDKAVGALDAFNSAANIGNGFASFGSYAVSGSLPASLGFAGTPFLYDPALGNLLLTVDISNATSFAGYQAFFQADSSGNSMSRAIFGASNLADGIGLVTGFQTRDQANVPELSGDGTGTLAAMGLGLILFWMKETERKALALRHARG